jgi:hypothetical protein
VDGQAHLQQRFAESLQGMQPAELLTPAPRAKGPQGLQLSDPPTHTMQQCPAWRAANGLPATPLLLFFAFTLA